MNSKQFNKNRAVKFKHFSRKGYALFSVCGREVIVGVLAVSTLAHAKAHGISVNTSLAADTLNRQETKLDEVIVTGERTPLTALQTAKIVAVVTRDEIQRAAAASVNDLLKSLPGVDVRQRGGLGVQTDIAVRGGNFDQTTILLNGVNISSPHTGHLSADLPVSPDDIERIEVLEGGYENGLCGMVNIVTTSPPYDKGIHALAHLQGGTHGYAGANGHITLSHPTSRSNANRIGAMLSAGYNRSDGATPNSAFSASRFFLQANATVGGVRLDAQAAYSYKPFEANTFYGSASTDQWESNERLMAALRIRKQFNPKGKTTGGINAGAYHNRWYDHYQWHRDNPSGENYHKVDAVGANIGAWLKTAAGISSLSADMRRESVWSTSLGLPLPEAQWQPTGGHDATAGISYKRHDTRHTYDLHAAHDIVLEKLTVSLGATAEYTDTRRRWAVLPNANIAFRPTDHWRLTASWTMACRQPTFTDLYYSGTNIEGNSNLNAERTSDFQIGGRTSYTGFTAEVVAFYSHKTDMIDWVTTGSQDTSDGIYRSVNFKMDNWGVEADLNIYPKELWGSKIPVKRFAVKYAYIDENPRYNVQVLQSKYALEYLRHKVVLHADLQLWRRLSLGVSWRYQHRTGTGNDPYDILDARLSWDAHRWSVHLDATNLLDRKYYDFIYIPGPGIVVMAGVKITI